MCHSLLGYLVKWIHSEYQFETDAFFSPQYVQLRMGQLSASRVCDRESVYVCICVSEAADCLLCHLLIKVKGLSPKVSGNGLV